MQDERIHQKTVVSQVMEKIRELITSGNYRPGDRIPTEQELAERFGIGRSSIREAVKIFQHLGVLESRVPKGTFVCSRSQISTEAITWAILLGDEDMFEIIELRQVLEERGFSDFVEKYCADDMSVPAVMEALEREVGNMRQAAQEGSLMDLIGADYNFHAVIIGESKNRLFTAIYATLHSFMSEEMLKTYRNMKDLLDVSENHRIILDAIKSKKKASAIREHANHFDIIRNLLNAQTHG
jgi:GntR family transcriptional repressor for pyruvate dehydrogenase complex